jgi:dual specificity MAP kinase phosphatase
MATAVLTASLPARTATPPPHLSINTSQRGTPAAVPNKHIPFCSPGPRPGSRQLDTPPTSPPSATEQIETTSLIYPPNGYPTISDRPPVYGITAKQLEKALDHLSSQPLPSTKQVFPWLHGLHAENQLQLAFFTARKKSLRRTPKCIRGLTIVKARGDLSHSKIKGAIAPEELLIGCCDSSTGDSCKRCSFLEIDPKDGFGVRNFQIQACKMATVSDVVVYNDMHTPKGEARRLAQRIARAQAAWQKKQQEGLTSTPGRLFNVFVLSGWCSRFKQ